MGLTPGRLTIPLLIQPPPAGLRIYWLHWCLISIFGLIRCPITEYLLIQYSPISGLLSFPGHINLLLSRRTLHSRPQFDSDLYSIMKSLLLSIVSCLFSMILTTALEDITQRSGVPANSFCSAPGSSCQLRTNGSFQLSTFKTQFNNLDVTGQGRMGNSLAHTSLTVNINGTPEIRIDGSFVDGVYTATFQYGAMFGPVHNLTLVARNDSSIKGTANNAELRPYTGAVARFIFANGTTVPCPRVPGEIRSDLQQLPDVAKAAVRGCQAAKPTKCWQQSSSAIMRRQSQNQFGIPPRRDNTSTDSKCLVCLGEAFAAEAACIIACGLSFGFGCVCIAAIPFAFLNCQSPGGGFAQGCCPVACGPVHEQWGISTVDQCCFSEDTCAGVDACCASGLQPCGGNTCCPSNAPCRDLGICCPTNQNICATQDGPVCCNEGEDCIQGVCCPRPSIVNGQCCPPESQTCCPTGTPSRCGRDSIQHCVNNQWVSEPCIAPQICLAIPIANAGVFCTCPPPGPGGTFCCSPNDPGCCYTGTPSRCGTNSIERCINNRWVSEPCLAPRFCLAIPVANAGVACSGHS